MRKIITLGIMLLFLGMTISSSTGIYLEKQSIKPISSGNIFYVGGNGTGNYTKIQDAIDNASSGDTVFVYNGTYVETITMKDRISLIGECQKSTIIKGNNNKYVVSFNSDIGSKINGFTISYVDRDGIYINNCSPIISNNTIIDNKNGINCRNYATPIIKNNIIINNSGPGIDCKSTSTPIINNNIIKNNFWGLFCWSSSSGEIFNNTITNNHATGITCLSASPKIIFNDISDNKGGILCYDSSPIIYKNFISNRKYGITCEPEIIFTPNGTTIMVCNSDFPKINGNTIINNQKGISCLYSSPIIKDNDIISNDIGIHFNFLSSGNQCEGNSTIFHNNFMNNSNQVYDDSDANMWDNGYPSGGNYWDDYTGNDSDGDGIGDTPYPITGGDNEDRYPLMEPFSGNQSPSVEIINPKEGYFHFSGIPILRKPFNLVADALSIGGFRLYPIIINATSDFFDSEDLIVKVYLDGEEQGNASYCCDWRLHEWFWTGWAFGTYTLTVTAEDSFGAIGSDEIDVWNFCVI